MDVLGSVKNRLKTMHIINRNKKLKLKKENSLIKRKKEIVNVKEEKIIFNKKYTLNKIDIELSNIKIEKKINTNLINNKKVEKYKISNKNIKNEEKIINNIQKEDKKAKGVIEEKIINTFKEYTKDAKKEIKKLKKALKIEEEKLNKIKTKKELDEYQKQLSKIKEKIDRLKNLYEGILNKYEFFGFEELNDSLFSKYIDDFKFKMPLNEIDILVETCKNEITYIEEIDNLIEKFNKISLKEENKKAKINYLDNDYYNRILDYDKLKKYEIKINNYIEKEKEYLINLEKEVENNTLDVKKNMKLVFNKEYVNNLYKLNIGLSLFNTTYIGAFIGAFLVKNSLTPLLLNAFDKKEILRYEYKYSEYINKITDNLSIIKQTNSLLTDSLHDITKLKQHMETEYKEYLKSTMYYELYKKIIVLEKNLISKQTNCLKLEEKLLEQKRKNNEKQKKLKEIIVNN